MALSDDSSEYAMPSRRKRKLRKQQSFKCCGSESKLTLGHTTIPAETICTHRLSSGWIPASIDQQILRSIRDQDETGEWSGLGWATVARKDLKREPFGNGCSLWIEETVPKLKDRMSEMILERCWDIEKDRLQLSENETRALIRSKDILELRSWSVKLDQRRILDGIVLRMRHHPLLKIPGSELVLACSRRGKEFTFNCSLRSQSNDQQPSVWVCESGRPRLTDTLLPVERLEEHGRAVEQMSAEWMAFGAEKPASFDETDGDE